MIFYPGGMKFQITVLETQLSKVRQDNEDMKERLGEMEKNLAAIVRAYKDLVPMRTADVHSVKCKCLRCMIDDAEALLKR